MLLKNLYQVVSKANEDNQLYFYEIKINDKHPVFKGHFPDNPVMPGVCMMQIIKELTESVLNVKLFMEKCSNVKFMALINPEENSNLFLELKIVVNDGKVNIRNTTKFDETVALKLSAQYKII